MRIVITRPEKKALRTSERLKEIGHTPIMMPLSYFTYNQQAIINASQKPYAAIAITSSEPLNALPIDICRQKIIFAVGKESATLAQKKGFSNIIHGTGNSIDLAHKIIQNRALFTQQKPLMYLGGKTRNYDFEDYLIKHQIPLRIINCYYTWNIQYSQDEVKKKLHNANAILFYAKSAVIHFFLLPLPKKMMPIRLICLSNRIASAVPLSYAKMVSVAHAPQEIYLFRLL